MKAPKVKSMRMRLSRFFHDGGRWYVDAREGRLGPFHCREQAARFLERFKRRVLIRSRT